MIDNNNRFEFPYMLGSIINSIRSSRNANICSFIHSSDEKCFRAHNILLYFFLRSVSGQFHASLRSLRTIPLDVFAYLQGPE